jgi:3-oxoacyl-[acyl-carrier-protein] synthase-3
MTQTVNVGVWSIGTFLPPIVRTNAWWPESIVEEWRVRHARRVTRGTADLTEAAMPEGARKLLAAASEFAEDPFEGSRERRVMPDEMWPTDMQIAAARDAIERAGVDPLDIDFLLVENTTPDYLVPDGCRVQLELGLRRDRLFTLQTNAVCNGFLQQLAVAEGLVRGGAFRCGLLIQCSVMSRHIRQADPFSAWVGDGATAQIVGAVAPGRGLLGHAHATDGRFHGGLVFGVPGKRWYEDGPVLFYIEDQQKARDMILTIADESELLLERSLQQAGVRRDEVRYFAAHQGTAWLGRAVQRHLRLDHATRIDTFPWAASLLGANIPLTLATGERDGHLRDGDVVVAFSGATGQTVGTMVARWGR